MSLMEKIDRLRIQRGLDQKELAERAGVSESRFSKWKGKTAASKGGPTLKQGVALARALGVTAEFLADDAQTEPLEYSLAEDERAIILVFRALKEWLTTDAVVRSLHRLARDAERQAATGRPPDGPIVDVQGIPGRDTTGRTGGGPA